MTEYYRSPVYMQEFYNRLVQGYREDFLHYLVSQTPYGSFNNKLENHELILRILYLLKGNLPTTDLAFSLKLAFDIPCTYKTLIHKMRNDKLYDSDLWEINCWSRGTIK